MAYQQQNPSNVVDDASIGDVAWSNPGNATSSNNVYATAQNPSGTRSNDTHYLKATNFGFTLPTNAIVLGIEVLVECKGSSSTAVTDNSVKIVKGGTITGTEHKKTGNWSTSDATRSYGSTTDQWGESWTPADINSTNFGVAISAVLAPNGIAYVDAFLILVHYAELVTAADTTTLSLSTEMATVRLSGSDAPTVTVEEASALTASLSATDTTTLALVEDATAGELVTVAGADTVALNVTDAAQPVVNLLAVSDDATLTATEGTASLTGEIQKTDAVTVATTESSSVTLPSADALTVILGEAKALTTVRTELGGLRLDAGPAQGTPTVSVFPVLRAQLRWELNDVGAFSAQVGVTTPGADQLDAGMEVRVIREGEGEIFRGLVSSRRVVIEDEGPVVEVEGYSTARELAWKTTQMNWRVANQAVSIAVSNLVSGTGWTATVDSTVSGQLVSAEFQGVTRFEAIQTLAQQVYRHVRPMPVERQIEVTKGERDSGLRCVLLPEWPNGEDDETLLPVTRIRVSRRDEEIVTRVIPLGAGEGPNALTLRWSTRTSPYPVQTMTGPDGRTIWYLEDTTASSTYGVRERVVAFKDVVPLANSAAELTRAANVLYDLAAAWLQAHAAPRVEWAVEVGWPLRQRDILTGAWRLVPGDTVRLIARGVVEDWDGKRTFVDLDENAFVRAIERRFSGDAEEVSLALTDSSRVVRDDDLLADVVERIWAVAVAQKTVPVREIHGPFRQTIDSGKPVRMVVDWDENVRFLHQAKLVLICRRIRSNATTAAAGGGQTSSGGSPHSHSVSGQSAQSGGGQTSSGGTAHSHSISGQTAENSGAHSHKIATLYGTNPWSNPPYQRDLVMRVLGSGGSTLQGVQVGHWSSAGQYDLEDNPATTHTHPVSGTTSSSESSHTHSVSDHTHTVSGTTSSSESSHTHSVSDHTHPLVYGIFEGSFPTAKAINVLVNGTNVTTVLGGPWDPAENTPLILDITQWLQEPDGRPKQQRNTVEIQASKLFDVEIAVKSLIAIATVVPV